MALVELRLRGGRADEALRKLEGLPVSDLAQRCKGQWPSILRALGVLDAKQVAGKDSSCPACGGKDRFRFTDKDGRGTWYCHGERYGSDGVALVMKVRGVDFKGAAELIEGVLGGPARRYASAEGDKPKDPLKAWREAQSDVLGTTVDIYLKGRGLTLAAAEARSLRFHPALFHWPTKGRWPAMVAAVGLAGEPPVTCHQTFLDVDGGAKAPIEKSRLWPALRRSAASGSALRAPTANSSPPRASKACFRP
jgi:putative DNA primase/helicase